MKFNLLKLALLFGFLTVLFAIGPKGPAHAVEVNADPNSMIAPTITADPNPVVIPIGQTQGTTTLSWDGGTDHPYAELWVKVDANDETFIVESGKNTRQVTIELGKTYLFKVSDANVTLASVTVTAKQQETPPPTGGGDPRDKIETSRDKAKVDKILKPGKVHKSFKFPPRSSIKPPARELIRLPLLGGPAGSDFEYICGTEEVLIGVRGYSGAWIDNVQAVCARAKDQLEAAVPEGPVFGGAAGQINNFAYCTGPTLATRLVVSETENRSALGSIFFGCQDFATKQQGGTSRPMQGGDPLATTIGVTQSCPANTVAVGIKGRAGTYLHALGLVCSSRP